MFEHRSKYCLQGALQIRELSALSRPYKVLKGVFKNGGKLPTNPIALTTTF
jgi:hypothetical protein